MKVKLFCCYCGQMFEKPHSKLKRVNFCCKDCLHSYNGEKMSFYNSTTNPMNIKGQETIEQRYRKRQRMLKPTSKCDYQKVFGDFEHRRVARVKIGRELKQDEVVHHIDGNPRNNNPNNLQVMTRAEHMRYHMRQYWAMRKAGQYEKK